MKLIKSNIFITETWFKQETEQKDFELERYKCIRKDRILNPTVTQGRGVCIYEVDYYLIWVLYKIDSFDLVHLHYMEKAPCR